MFGNSNLLHKPYLTAKTSPGLDRPILCSILLQMRDPKLGGRKSVSRQGKMFLLSATLVLLGFGASTVNADTITFNGVIQTTYGPDRGNLTTQGFLFSSNGHFHTNESFGFIEESLGGFQTSASNGTIYASAHDGLTITMQMENASPFSLNGLDVAEHIAGANSFRNAMQITITGFLMDSGTVMQTFDLDGVIDGPGGAADFQTFLVGANFINLQSVVFSGLGGTAQEFSIDNIVVNQGATAVPEPATMLLLGTGIAGVAAKVRRRR